MEESEDIKSAPRKRATRKRATRKTADKSSSEAVRVLRRGMSKEKEPAAEKKPLRFPVSKKTAKESDDTAQSRKAPTPIARKRAGVRHKRRQQLIVGALLLVGVVASAAVGFTDDGQIDIDATVEARNERIRTNTTDAQDVVTSTMEVPVQTSSVKHTGATLRGRGTGVSNTPSVPMPVSDTDVSSSTATSTDETASTTQAVASSTDEMVEVSSENQDSLDAQDVVDEDYETIPSEQEGQEIVVDSSTEQADI